MVSWGIGEGRARCRELLLGAMREAGYAMDYGYDWGNKVPTVLCWAGVRDC